MWKLHVMVPETKTPWPLEHAYSVRQDRNGRMWAIVEGTGPVEDIDAMVRTLSEAFGYGKDWTRFALEASQDWFRSNTKDLMPRPIGTGFQLAVNWPK